MSHQRTDRAAPPSLPPETLSGVTCVVTGASRGIGRAIALELGVAGADVVVNYSRSTEQADAVIDRIESAGGGSAISARADVSDPTAVTELVRRTDDAFGQIDVLVNNAGITDDARFDRLTPAKWHRVIDVNLHGPYYTTRAFYDDLVASDNGRLINVSSVIGQRGNVGQANYAAAKSALGGFTRSLAAELAPHDTTANCVAPGYTQTEMVEAVSEDILDRIREDIPLDRFARVEEIAHAVAFLASPRAGYITGETLNVNGGLYG